HVAAVTVARQHLYRQRFEEVAASPDFRAIVTDTQAMLLVELRYQRHRTLAEFVADHVQAFTAELQQSAQRTAGNVAGDVDRPVAGNVRNFLAAVVEFIFGGGQPIGFVTGHQRLTVADEHTDHAVVLWYHQGADPRRDLLQQRIAPVEQVI